MKKLADFIVEKRKIILIVFVLLALCCAWLSTKVSVNTDMTKYLPNDSPTKIGLEIMDAEFPATCSINVMFENLGEDEKTQIYDTLAGIENVGSVTYDAESENYNKDGYSLYSITMDYGAYSPEAKTVVDTVREKYPDTVMNGEAAGNNLAQTLPFMVSVALGVLFIILFLMCSSWLEPFLFLINIAVAVLLNMGTNLIFDSVSDTTNSIASILQVCLSMDYSIMLLNRYRQEKQTETNNLEAMKKALAGAFTAISSSAVTTIVGMLMLVFMSFTIGVDLGLVLAKGVFLSLLCIFTVLPALILIANGLLEKTKKKPLHFNMNKIASFGYSARIFISVGFVILFAGAFFLRSNVNITYTMGGFDRVNQVFTPENNIVVLYDNKDENSVAVLAEKWKENASVDSINAYSTTLGMELDYMELADITGMDETLIALMYNFYFDEKNEEEQKISLGDFLQFLKNDIAANEQFASLFDEDALAMIDALSGEDAQPRLSAGEFAAYGGMDITATEQIFGYYFSMNEYTKDGKIAIGDLTQFLMTEVAINEQFAPLFTEDNISQLQVMSGDASFEQEMTSGEIAGYMGFEKAIAEQLFNYYAVINGEIAQGKIALYDFIKFITTEVAHNEQFAPYFTDDVLISLNEAEAGMDDGIKQLVGENFSRLIINTNLPEESEETFNFISGIEQDLSSTLGEEYYVVGNSAMAYEMSNSFPDENNFITILTAISIFLVVAIAFRSISIPLILVLVIQCAVFITMGSGNSIYYLPLLIVQCLLMGATIDYGILYTSYYREARKCMDKKKATISALNNSIHAILTSGLILAGITFLLGIILRDEARATSDILLTVAKGSSISMVLVVFVLPSLLAALDRFVCGKRVNRNLKLEGKNEN